MITVDIANDPHWIINDSRKPIDDLKSVSKLLKGDFEFRSYRNSMCLLSLSKRANFDPAAGFEEHSFETMLNSI